MSTTIGSEEKYQCRNDCRMEGCPGHILRTDRHNTSTTMSITIDGKQEYIFDIDCFKAAYKSMLAWGKE